VPEPFDPAEPIDPIEPSVPPPELRWPDDAADLAALADLYDAETAAALDAWEPPSEPRPLPSRLTQWSRSAVMGAVITGFGRGLEEVLKPKEEPAIVIEVDADGEPHDLPIRLFLDPDDPSGSLCVVRRDPPPPVV
jgi:hypothetical protein